MTFSEWELNEGFLMPLSDEERDIARNAWNAATEAAKPRWIPVTERLPDKEGKYPMKFTGFDLFWIIHYKPGITVFDGEITHWMEMPD